MIVHRATGESDFPAVARHMLERVAEQQAQVDVELLWQSLGGKHSELAASELAVMFFGEDNPEAASAVFRALNEDALFFKRKGTQFLPKTEEQVSTELIRRERQRAREEFRQRVTTLISELVRNSNFEMSPEMQPVIDRIYNWLRLKTGDEVGNILEQVAGSTKARDTAYDILLRAGKIDPAADRFLVTAGIEDRFAAPLLEAAGQLVPFTHVSSRLDYRDTEAFTIDDEDTSEVDDAITVVRNGAETVIGIHIADVSAFVFKGDLLDAEASQRSSTIYLPATTVRMLPDRVSTDLASLNAHELRPAFTVEVRFDEQGNRVGYRIALSSIQVGRRLSYDQADQAIASGDESLQLLYNIAIGLHRARAERGAITFRRPELKIRVEGEEIHIKKIDPNSPSRTLVSEMMILANGLSADFASVNALPVIFRTQEPRDALVVEDAPSIEALAFERLRKTFKRSRLSLTPGAHSGLGLTAYTQVSSPIRRYADLVTQRQFTATLSGNPTPHTREELLQILANAEAAEQEIRSIEDRSTQYWLLRYLAREKMNEVLYAVVLDARGTVELEDYYIRGRITGSTKEKPGARIRVGISSIDAVRGDIRFEQA